MFFFLFFKANCAIVHDQIKRLGDGVGNLVGNSDLNGNIGNFHDSTINSPGSNGGFNVQNFHGENAIINSPNSAFKMNTVDIQNSPGSFKNSKFSADDKK